MARPTLNTQILLIYCPFAQEEVRLENPSLTIRTDLTVDEDWLGDQWEEGQGVVAVDFNCTCGRVHNVPICFFNF